MSIPVKFKCLVCERTFKASQQRAERGVCPECEEKQRTDIQESAYRQDPVPRDQVPDEQVVPRYGSLRNAMSILSTISLCFLWVAALPVVGIVFGIMDKNPTTIMLSASGFVSIVSIAVTGWVTGNLVQIVIDMANNLASIELSSRK